MAIRKLSCIIPCYNESEVLPDFYSRACAVAKQTGEVEFEFLFVNDGSADATGDILNTLAARDARVKVLHFARNKGHQAAITAGMDFCTGDVAVIIDADLQDPPEMIPEILAKIREGYQIVHMQRRTRKGETIFKLASSWMFYKLMSRLTDGNIIEHVGDFRAITRPVLETVRYFREGHRFMRGILASLGFRQCVLPYDRDRRFAGTTKYPFGRMFLLAINAVLSFSTAPIRLITWFAVLSWLISLAYLTEALIDHFVYKITVQGWTSIIILLTFFSGVIIFCLGIVASYVGRIFEQGQQRPIYWLSDVRNIRLDRSREGIKEVDMAANVLADRAQE